MTINYKPDNSDEYLWVDDYDYNTIIISSTPEIIIVPQEQPPKDEDILDISGIEEIHVPVLYCCTIDRDSTIIAHELTTPVYGYLREDIHIENIGLKCVNGKLNTIANISYDEDGEEVTETICTYKNGWYKCDETLPSPSTRGQVRIHSDGRVNLRVVWGTESEIKEIVHYKFTSHIPVEDRHITWAIHVQSDKLYVVIASTLSTSCS